jgi:23S rRNA (uracil747-C5)-methyltransferase
MKQSDTDLNKLCSEENHKAENYERAQCGLFSSNLCLSCSLLSINPGDRITAKLSLLAAILSQHNIRPQAVDSIVLPTHPWHSRHKFKLSVTGPLESPSIGLVKPDGSSVELLECPLTPIPIRALLYRIKELITTYRVTPYDIQARTGELKYVIVTSTHDDGQGIVRFVLRSSESIPRLRKAVPELQGAFPWVRVVSCNIQPTPAAIIEGPHEEILSPESFITERFGEIALHLTPQSFMQVTPEVAAQLYALAAHHAQRLTPRLVLDLFCGVGGFSLHVAPHAQRVVGVELSPSATECAQRSAADAGYTHAEFHAADVDQFLYSPHGLSPDMVIVNPPRRGLSEDIIARLCELRPETILYSSCNPETFARDVQLLSSSYSLERLSPFDMFPLTKHCEVLGLLVRANKSTDALANSGA